MTIRQRGCIWKTSKGIF